MPNPTYYYLLCNTKGKLILNNIKKTIVFLIGFSISSLWANEIKEIDKVGSYVFEAVKNYNGKNDEEFIANYLFNSEDSYKMIEEYQMSAAIQIYSHFPEERKKTLPLQVQRAAKLVHSITQRRLNSSFDNIKEQVSKYNLDLSKIIFRDFSYRKIDDRDEFLTHLAKNDSLYIGTLEFSFQDELFSILSVIINYKDNYHLWFLSDLKKVSNTENKKL